MAIMIPGAKIEKQKALQQIRETGHLLIEKIVYLDSEHNVIEITELRRKSIELEKYKKYTRLTSIVAIISATIAGVLLWII